MVFSRTIQTRAPTVQDNPPLLSKYTEAVIALGDFFTRVLERRACRGTSMIPDSMIALSAKGLHLIMQVFTRVSVSATLANGLWGNVEVSEGGCHSAINLSVVPWSSA